jgi:phosphoribosylaminoimidazole-succinocarboxamide synthase
MTDEYITSVSDRYIELYENITGKTFEKANTSDIISRIETNVFAWMEKRV